MIAQTWFVISIVPRNLYKNKKGARHLAGPIPREGENYFAGVQSCAGGNAMPIFVFSDGKVLKIIDD